MATIVNTIRWADNTEELKKNLLEGIGTVDAMKSSVDRLANSLGGQGLLQAANRATAAVDQMGGILKLTADQQRTHADLLERAIERYGLLGQKVPPLMQQQLTDIKSLSNAWTDFTSKFSIEKAIANPIGTATDALGALAETMGSTAVIAFTMVASFVAVGTALFKLAVDAAKFGGQLDDMSDKTGISVPVLSKMSYAADVVGTSLESLTGVVFKLEQKMGEGGKAFEEGLNKMGLSTNELKAAGPDHYLELVAMGLQSIADPAERAAAGTAVLGKGYKDVAAELNDLARAMEMTSDIDVWTTEDASNAEAFEMEMASLKVHVQQLALALGKELIPALTTMIGWLPELAHWLKVITLDFTGISSAFAFVKDKIDWVGAAWDTFKGKVEGPIKLDAIEQAKKKLKELQDAAKDAAGAPDALVKKWKEAAAGMAASAPTMDQALHTAAMAERELTDAANASIETHKKAIETQKKFEEQQKKNTDAVHKLEAGFFGLRESVGQADDRELAFVRRSIELKAAVDKVENSAHVANFGFKGMADGLQNVGDKVKDLGPDIEHQFVGPIQEATKVTKTFHETFDDAFKQLPSLISKAFTGGGGISGALNAFGATIGGSLFSEGGALSKVTEKATGSLTSMFGKTIGGALGAAIPGIGSLIGPGLEMLWGGIKKLFGGPSQAELQGRATVQEFETKLRGMLTVQQQAEAAGRNWAATNIAVRDAFLATGRTAAEAEQVVLRLWDTKNPEAYKGAIDEINAVMNEQAADQARAKQLIDEYGISIEQLGPKWRAQQLGDQAKSLMNDYRLMVDVLGVEAPQAMELMAGKLSTFVQQSVAASTEIPANMQPMLQQMADMGLLTDENGNKITDLKDYGVTFAETFGQGVDRIVAKFDELIARLTQSADGINAIPDSKSIDVSYNVHWNVPPMPQPNESIAYGAHGGLVTNHGIQYFGGGGTVLPFAPRGGDRVPAMLTPGEGVLSNNDMMALGGPGGFRAFRRMLHMGGGSTGTGETLDAMLATQQRQTRYFATDFKNDLARAVRDELQKARVA